MIYVVIVLVILVVALGYALYTNNQKDKVEAEEQQRLLDDYQRRVNEQQKLLEDYRALEKNFDNVGEGYEQALLAFDKMNEDQEKSKKANETLQKTVASLQETNARLQENAQKKAEAMTRIISDLLQLASTQSDGKLSALVGKITDLEDLPADQAPFERGDNPVVPQIAEQAVQLSGIDKAQYIKFEQEVDPSAAATMLLTNQPKAVRALTHLLDNALKFTTDGSVKLIVSVDMDKMLAVYAVEDTGSGIEAADAERIFERFVKLDSFQHGIGLGLPLSRKLAEQLDGTIYLDTNYTGGARFYVKLPI